MYVCVEPFLIRVIIKFFCNSIDKKSIICFFFLTHLNALILNQIAIQWTKMRFHARAKNDVCVFVIFSFLLSMKGICSVFFFSYFVHEYFLIILLLLQTQRNM